MVFGQQKIKRIESNSWTTYGNRVADFPRIHYSGNPQPDSTDDELCVNNSMTMKEYAERLPHGHWSFLEPGSEKKWYGTHDCKADGSWNRTAEKMLQNFAISGYPIFRCASALERRELRSKEGKRSQYTSTVAMKPSSCFSAQ